MALHLAGLAQTSQSEPELERIHCAAVAACVLRSRHRVSGLK